MRSEKCVFLPVRKCPAILFNILLFKQLSLTSSSFTWTNWSSLIQKIYEVDPLVCPKCQGTMRIISFIEDGQVIRAILEHFGLLLARARPPPKIQYVLPVSECAAADLQLQTHNDTIYGDPEYTWDEYIQSSRFKNLRRAGEVCPEKAQICLLCLGKSQISESQATIDGILNSTSLYHQTPTQHLVERKY